MQQDLLFLEMPIGRFANVTVYKICEMQLAPISFVGTIQF